MFKNDHVAMKPGEFSAAPNASIVIHRRASDSVEERVRPVPFDAIEIE